LEIKQSQLLRRGDDEVADFFHKYSTDGVAPRGGMIRKGTTKLGVYIWHTRHREALDLRDKIYGMLGLVPDWIDTTPITPDYSVSSYHVFRDAFLKLRSTSGATDRTNNLLLLTLTACRDASGRAYSYSYA
jgi:hypothetical protein